MRDYDKDRSVASPARCDATQHALERFLNCLSTRDLKGLEELLTEDIVAITDGGGEVNALRSPMLGRQAVLRFVTRWNEANQGSARPRICKLNGLPAVLVQRDNVKPGQAAYFTLQCEVDSGGRIRKLLYVLAPGKLTKIAQTPKVVCDDF